MVNVIQILQCHNSDFINHRGWWAVFTKEPWMAKGVPVDFNLQGTPEIVKATIDRIIEPNDPDRSEGQKDFVNWVVIEYSERIDDETQHIPQIN